MTERINDTAIMDEEGEIIPYDKDRDGNLPRNADLIEDAELEATVDELQRQEDARQEAEERQRMAEADYDDRLERLAETLHGDYKAAAEVLASKGINPPAEFNPTEAIEVQELRAKDHSLQEERFGLTGDTSLRTSEDDLALKALARESDELFIRNIMKNDPSISLDGAKAILQAKKDHAARDRAELDY